MTTNGFGIHQNRPKVTTVSPLKLTLACLMAAMVILSGFLVPHLIAGLGGPGETDQSQPYQTAHQRTKNRFEDAPASYGEVAVKPVSLIRPIKPAPEPEPIVIIKEVPAQGSFREPPPDDLAARHSDVSFAVGARDGGSVMRLGARTVPAGHRLEAKLMGGINSETPGLVLAEVTNDPNGLIPAGARLVGSYDGRGLSFVAGRLPVTFTELQASGRAIAIKAQATDRAGMAGLPGEVDRHVDALVGLSALNVLTGAAVSSTARRGDDLDAALAGETIREGSRLSRTIARQTIDTSPTIQIAAGTTITVTLIEALRL
ncbi:MAG: TrbI/VirB10 family protein [Geminicoccaceae bacterium]